MRQDEKTLRVRLKTGEWIVRKAVVEFLVGRVYFVLVNTDNTPEAFCIENILSAELLSKGEFVPIALTKAGKK